MRGGEGGSGVWHQRWRLRRAHSLVWAHSLMRLETLLHCHEQAEWAATGSTHVFLHALRLSVLSWAEDTKTTARRSLSRSPSPPLAGL